MTRLDNKVSRLLQIEALLLAHPEGLRQAEIARRVGVHRSIIHRYLPDLSTMFAIYETEDGRLAIDRNAYPINVSFSLHEALGIHLAARLMATRMDRRNPHTASALRKLGLALERLAPHISRHLVQSADVMDGSGQRDDPAYLHDLEVLTLAWAEQRKVKVWHHSERTDTTSQYVFSPYFIEPYAIGQTAHTIGFSDPPEALRTFKIERIERVELLEDRFNLPTDFDPSQLLADAWGIWYTEGEPVEVCLHFSARVAGRVKETRWHRSQHLEGQPDGSVIWRACVAEPKEMLPWIRGWGADVEVIIPEELREAVKSNTLQLMNIYRLEIEVNRDNN